MVQRDPQIALALLFLVEPLASSFDDLFQLFDVDGEIALVKADLVVRDGDFHGLGPGFVLDGDQRFLKDLGVVAVCLSCFLP